MKCQDGSEVMSREPEARGESRHSMAESFSFFESIEVWQLDRALNKKVYVLSQTSSKKEMFGLTLQLRRACFSVLSNNAEERDRNSHPDFAHLLEIAYGLLMEVASLLLALDQNYISNQDLDSTLAKIDLLAA
jgi:four helix bundle protein